MADSGETLTYGELVLRAHQTANLFSSLGLTQGDTIAILMENSIRCPELMWAAKDSGIRYVVVNSHLNAADTSFIIADSGAKLLIASPTTADLARAALVDIHDVALITLDSTHDILLAAQPSTPLIGRHRGPSMLYSSGTTGRPKGVKTSIEPVSPETPPRRFAMLQQQYGLGADTVFLNPAPFYHAGPNRFMMSVLRAGERWSAFVSLMLKPH
jgi:long-chain acyl-CoA synthetase